MHPSLFETERFQFNLEIVGQYVEGTCRITFVDRSPYQLVVLDLHVGAGGTVPGTDYPAGGRRFSVRKLV